MRARAGCVAAKCARARAAVSASICQAPDAARGTLWRSQYRTADGDTPTSAASSAGVSVRGMLGAYERPGELAAHQAAGSGARVFLLLSA